MAENDLENLIPESLIKRPLELAENLKPIVRELNAIIKSGKLLNSAIDGSKSTLEIKKITQALFEEQKQLQNIQNALNESIKPPGGVKEYAGAIKKLREELKQAKDQMAGIAAALGEDSEEYKKAALNAGQLTNRLNGLQQSTKAVSGEPIERLGGSIDLIKSKVSALDFKGAQQGIKQFTQASKDLTFKQATQGLGEFVKGLGTMAKALLTNPLFLLVAVVVGIGIAVYKLKDNIKILTIAFDAVGAALDYVIQAGKDFLDWVELSTFALDEKAAKTVEAADKEIKAIEKRYDREIQIVGASGKKTIDLEKQKWNSVLQEASKALNELFNKQVRNNNKLTDEELKKQAELYDIVANANTELQVLENKRLKEEADKRKEAALKEENDLFKLQQFRLKVAIEQQEDLLNNDKLTYNTRLKAEQVAQGLRRKLVELEFQHALDQENLSTAEILLIQEERNKKLYDVREKGAKEREDLLRKQVAKDIKVIEDEFEAIKKASKQRIDETNEDLKVEIQAIQQLVIKGVLTRKQGDEAILKSQKKLGVELIEENIATLEQTLLDAVRIAKERASVNGLTKEQEVQLAKESAEEQAAIQSELSDLRFKLTEALYNNLKKQDTNQLDGLKKFLETVEELYSGFAGSLGNLFNTLTENRLENIEREESALERQTAAELRAVGDNDEAKAEIENRAARRQEELEKRKIAAQRKQAVFDKATSAVQAAIAGALAVVSMLKIGPAGIPLSIAAGITAGIEVAAILAKNIPQYFKGTPPGGHLGGLAYVGEQGPELVRYKNGDFAITPAEKTLMDLEPGAEVIPHKPSMKMIATAGLYAANYRSPREPKSNNNDLSRQFEKLGNIIKNKRELKVNISKRAVELSFRNGQTVTRLMDELFS